MTAVGHLETFDPRTRALLEKLTEDAPELAGLLAKALHDGVISPDMAHTLDRAARNINEDVAGSLAHATLSINPEVADRISMASHELESATKGLERALSGFRGASGSLASFDASIAECERVTKALDVAAQNAIFAAQARNSANGWSWKSFGLGAAACFTVGAALLLVWTFAPQP